MITYDQHENVSLCSVIPDPRNTGRIREYFCAEYCNHPLRRSRFRPEPPAKGIDLYGINFISSGGVTFSDSDTLGMSTDLDNAHWNYTLILDGNPNTPQIVNGKKLDLSGWDLSYPSRRDLSMKVILTGDVPVVTATQPKILIDIADYSGNGVVPGY